MNCHTENIFTGHSVYLCLKSYAGKKGSLSASKWISYLRNMQWRGGSLVTRTIWFLYLRDNPAFEIMILVAAICISSFKSLC